VSGALEYIGALAVIVAAILGIGWLANRYPLVKHAGVMFVAFVAVGSALYLIALAVLAIFGAEDAITWK
jgi:hypothetical protein